MAIIDYGEIASLLLIFGFAPFVLVGLYFYFYFDKLNKNHLQDA